MPYSMAVNKIQIRYDAVLCYTRKGRFAPSAEIGVASTTIT